MLTGSMGVVRSMGMGKLPDDKAAATLMDRPLSVCRQ